jgi:hypothetical protein
MSESHDVKTGIVARMRRWIGGRIVADVPEHVAACEFECRAHECSHGKWENCEYRIQGGDPGKA